MVLPLSTNNDTITYRIQECGVVLKLERFSHLSGQSFGLGLSILIEIRHENKSTYMHTTQKVGYTVRPSLCPRG